MGDDKVIHKIALMLKERGITPQLPIVHAKRVLENYVTEQLRQYRVEISAEIQADIHTIIEIFGDIYDEKIKPLLEISTIPQNSTIPLSDRKMPG